MATRGITMQLLGPYTLHANEFLPYTTTITNWATAGSSHLITYDSNTKHFFISNASYNDYLVIWYLDLKTATISRYPIFGLEFSYGEIYRCDYSIAPCKTVEFCNSSIYHISSNITPDILSIGLKAVGEVDENYILSSASNCNITAHINILGL